MIHGDVASCMTTAGNPKLAVRSHIALRRHENITPYLNSSQHVALALMLSKDRNKKIRKRKYTFAATIGVRKLVTCRMASRLR